MKKLHLIVVACIGLMSCNSEYEETTQFVDPDFVAMEQLIAEQNGEVDGERFKELLNSDIPSYEECKWE